MPKTKKDQLRAHRDFFDRLAMRFPDVVRRIGLPSRNENQSASHHTKWAKLAPMVAKYAKLQGVPEKKIDWCLAFSNALSECTGSHKRRLRRIEKAIAENGAKNPLAQAGVAA